MFINEPVDQEELSLNAVNSNFCASEAKTVNLALK